MRNRKPILDFILDWRCLICVWKCAGSERLKRMHLVLLAFKSSWRPRKKSCMALKLVWRVVNSVQRRARSTHNGVACVEVDQRLTSSKSNINDVYREESRPKN